MIKILLAEDEHLLRQGLKYLLQNKYSDLQIIGEAENGIEAIQKVKILNPDLVIMDICLPKMDGLAATKIITQKFPHTKVIILASFHRQDYIDEAIKLKVSGYLLKNIFLEELVDCIHLAMKGYMQFSPGVLDKSDFQEQSLGKPPEWDLPMSTNMQVKAAMERLTKREREVLTLIILGCTNRQIAQKLFISERTVKNHVTGILTCLNVSSRVEAANLARSFLSTSNIVGV